MLAGCVPGALERIDGVGFSFGAAGPVLVLPVGWGSERGGVRPACSLGAGRSSSGARFSRVSGAGSSGG